MAGKKKSEPVYQLTEGKTVKALLVTAKRVGKKTAELNGELGAAVANAVEHKYLHRKAFSFINQLNKMEPEKLAEFKAHFDHYWIEAGLEERAESAPRMEMGEEAGDKKDDKVVPMQRAAE